MLVFTRVTYAVTFTESGMPYLAGGGVTFNGGSMTPFGVGGLVTFAKPNGSYSYTITAASGYLMVGSTPFSPVSLNGAAVLVTVTFEAVYTVTFAATGLPSGTNWSVTLTGGASTIILIAPSGSGSVSLTRWSDGAPDIRFVVSNGSYSFLAPPRDIRT